MKHKKIGILGGGQLGRMLIQEAIDLDLEIHVLDPSSEAPCRDIAHRFVVGSFNDFQTVYDFGQSLDLITIEIEKVNVDALQELQKQGKDIYPQPEVIRLIQDKRLQKQFYKENQLATADFILIDHPDEISKHLDFLPAFQKLGKGGYDGRGVQKLATKADLPSAFQEPSLLEKLVAIEKEISVIVARNPSGDIACFPPVELVFDPKLNLVDYLHSPTSLSPEKSKEARELAKQLIQSLDMIGLLAVEMFLDKHGQILINEVAPRPHNSGHHTIEANITSQFAQHLRAILDLPLGDTSMRQGAAMVNILGGSGHQGKVNYQGIEEILAIPGAYVHIYGKQETKPGRKMGHVTLLGNNLEDLQQKIQKVKKHLKVLSLD